MAYPHPYIIYVPVDLTRVLPSLPPPAIQQEPVFPRYPYHVPASPHPMAHVPPEYIERLVQTRVAAMLHAQESQLRAQESQRRSQESHIQTPARLPTNKPVVKEQLWNGRDWIMLVRNMVEYNKQYLANPLRFKTIKGCFATKASLEKCF